MGLDTYACVTDDTPKENYTTDNEGRRLIKAKKYDNINNLCGGMFSGNGNGGSFRGKVYAGYVERVTGESLFQDEIPNSVVEDMADLLGSAAEALKGKDDDLADDNGYEITNGEVRDLAKWFRVTADAGYGVTGWW